MKRILQFPLFLLRLALAALAVLGIVYIYNTLLEVALAWPPKPSILGITIAPNTTEAFLFQAIFVISLASFFFAILNIFKRKPMSFVKNLPAILTTLGLFGTFLGLTGSLRNLGGGGAT